MIRSKLTAHSYHLLYHFFNLHHSRPGVISCLKHSSWISDFSLVHVLVAQNKAEMKKLELIILLKCFRSYCFTESHVATVLDIKLNTILHWQS